MSRWTYFALLAGVVACFGVAEASLNPQPVLPGWTLLLLPLLAAVLAVWWWRHPLQTDERALRRTCEASPEAAFIALRGTLGELGYAVTMCDRDAGRLQFKGGTLGPWIGRLGVECTASVQRTAERESEIVISGQESPAERHGRGFMIYREGMGRRAAKILDRVQATVVTYRMIDAAPVLPSPGDT